MDTLEKIQIVVLLGGLGTRLKEVITNRPKPMADVYGKPFLYYQIKLLKWYGFNNFIFCVGYKGDIIEEYFKDGIDFGIKIKYSYDGDTLLGTGGAIRKALALLDEDFMVIYGDSFLDIEYPEIIYKYIKQKQKANTLALMTVFKNINKYDKSNVVFKDGKVLKYGKKTFCPEMEYIDYGVSIFNRNVFNNLPENSYVDLSDIQTRLTNERLMEGFEIESRFYEIGTPHSLDEFRNHIKNKYLKKRPAIFLDRDGTINEIVFNDDTETLDSPLEPQQLKLLPNTINALRIFTSMGYIIIVVTNQPAAAKGKVSIDKLYDVNRMLKEVAFDNGIVLDDILMCTHYPKKSGRTKYGHLIKECECRKPKPGLLLKAMEKYNIDLENSFMVGDSYIDIIAGENANVRTVFVGSYKCDTCQLLNNYKPDYIFDSLNDFAINLKK